MIFWIQLRYQPKCFQKASNYHNKKVSVEIIRPFSGNCRKLCKQQSLKDGLPEAINLPLPK